MRVKRKCHRTQHQQCRTLFWAILVMQLLFIKLTRTAASQSATAVVGTDGTVETITSACRNEHESCDDWAKLGECEKNAEYMNDSCRKSCNLCGDTINNKTEMDSSIDISDEIEVDDSIETIDCRDDNESCDYWANSGECEKNAEYMRETCRKSCGVCSIDNINNKVDANTETTLPCHDDDESCDYWAKNGECENNPEFMNETCRKSCKVCRVDSNLECLDLDDRCPWWIGHGRNPYCIGESEDFYYATCPKSCKSCGLGWEELEALKKKRRLLATVGGDERLLETPYGYEQKILDDNKEKEIKENIIEMEKYMSEVVWVDPKYERVRESCRVRNDQCAYYKSMGYCDKTKQTAQTLLYMRQNCGPFCGNCEELDFFHRCPMDESIPKAIQPGELHPIFERILTEPAFQAYKPRALRRPNNGTINEGGEDQPYLLVLDEFLSEEECDTLIELGQKIGYAESVDTGAKRQDGSYGSITSTWRTSSTAWCSDENGCLMHEIPSTIALRVESLTGIPQENAEHLQLLKYHEDQYYKYHHDCTPHHAERQMGVRVLTFFLYLNTIESGGGTHFPNLEKLTVQPKKGRAVLWPNVLNDKPNSMDVRTAHQALPVEAGSVKFAANYWIHQRNWREVYKRGCI